MPFIDPTSVTIIRSERQRREVGDVSDLIDSFRRIGQINAIVLRDQNILVAGERRLTAALELGWTQIEYKLRDDLTSYEQQVLELEENVRRKELEWKDECLAVLAYHDTRKSAERDWTISATSSELGYSESTISNYLSVAAELIRGNTKVVEADKFSVALNATKRDNDRRASSTLNAIGDLFDAAPKIEATPASDMAIPSDQVTIPTSTKPARRVPILHDNFLEWAPAYSDQPFNFLHCDFPYGINVADGPRQNAGLQDHYDDTPEVYFQLLECLGDCTSTLIANSAHLIFWFSMKFYEETHDRLTKQGWELNPFPLIWHKSDNTGVAPDPNRQPRRTYETAFFGIRGDRKLTSRGTKANSFAHPGRTEKFHISQKPIPMLTHFFEMVVDDYTSLLDPTCGSGGALQAASGLGANKVLGLEKDPEFYADAVRNFYRDTTDE